MTDIKRVGAFAKMVDELIGAGIRINEEPPKVLIEKKTSGGLDIFSNFKQRIDKETIKDIAREYGIKNGIITLQENITMSRLFDAFSGNKVYVPAIFVINKVDEEPKYKDMVNGDFVGISADKKEGIDDLINKIWIELKFVTVYILDGSMVMREDDTLKDVSEKIGSDFASKVKGAKINGPGAKFADQEVSLETKVIDGMQIRFIA